MLFMCSTRLLTVCGQMMKRGTIRGQAEWRFSLFCVGHSMTLLYDQLASTIVSEKPLEAKGKGK